MSKQRKADRLRLADRRKTRDNGVDPLVKFGLAKILQHGDARKLLFARGRQRHRCVSLVVAVKHARVAFLKCGRVTLLNCAYLALTVLLRLMQIMSNMAAIGAKILEIASLLNADRYHTKTNE